MILRVVDFETTGTEPPAQVIEVGRCDVVLDRFEASVRDWRSMLCGVSAVSAETRAVHHIELADVASFEPFHPEEFVLSALEDGVHALVAHHADFEAKWLTAEVRRGLPMLCTYKAALRVFPEAPGHGNQVLRYWLQDLGLTKPDRGLCQPAHRAGPDAYATAWTLSALLAKASVPEMLTWTTEPAVLPTFPIGKQRGAKWPDVEEGFLFWMLRQGSMEEALKWNARRELARRGLVSA